MPPNGGWLAWSQVVGAWAIFFNTWGIVNIFGSFQTFYETGALFEESSSNISWIGAVQSFLLLLVGALTGPVCMSFPPPLLLAHLIKMCCMTMSR